MKPNRLRPVLWFLIAALVFPLLQAAPAATNAAASIYFQFNDFSTDPNAPTDVNSNITDIAGTFSGVSASSITYKIEQISNGKAVQTTTGSTSPSISGNTFRFAGVSLYDGVNRITVSGTNNAGNTVTGTAYVNFNNVPVITSIKLSDGRTLPAGSTLVTTRASEAINITASNASKVSINGRQMVGGSGTTFVLSNIGLTPGLNKLVIIASNGTKTYEQTRYLAYYDGSFVAFDVKIANASISQSLDNNPTFSTPITGGTISGKIVIDSNLSAPDVELDLFDGTTHTTIPATASGSPLDSGTGYKVYSFTADNPVDIDTSNSYTLTVVRTAPTTANFALPFKFKNTTDPYINDVQQAYSVTLPSTAPGAITYTSISSFPNNTTVSRTPLWLILNTGNFDASNTATYKTTVTATQGGVPVPASSFVVNSTQYWTQSGQPAVLITNMPSGTVDLTFTITNTTTSSSESLTRTITYIPAPSIQLDNLYDGMTWKNPFISTDRFKGKLINFNLTNDSELDTLKLTFNGVTYPLLPAGPSSSSNIRVGTDGSFSFNPMDPNNDANNSDALDLVPGPNTLIFSGVASGVPVSTTLTIYYFTEDNPAISDVFPVPFVVNPTTDTSASRAFSDENAKFVPTNTKEYRTTETSLDLKFKISNSTDYEIQVNGQTIATVSTLTDGTTLKSSSQNSDATGVCFDSPSSACSVTATKAATMELRLWGVNLPQSGSTSITIIARAGTVSVTETVTIIRDLSPYILLSPKLPDESVINSNFLKISIKAEGASQVLIGKTEMTKGQGDIFRYEMKGLKPGTNTIKFTVVQGTQKINGSFSVNYAADDSVAAQYKTSIPKNGKISVFENDLTLTFPKNTFLRQANQTPGEDVKAVDLFDTQELYFGIADRTNGRTIKKYNAVGETDSAGNYLDGTIVDLTNDTDVFASDRLRPSDNFSFAGNVYWIDAGYFEPPASATDPYTLVAAMDPFAEDNVFYNRVYDLNKWLEPTQRGTITLKYDSNIVDAQAPNLSIWHYTSNGWENIGGVVNTKNKTVTASFDSFGYYTVMSLRYSFSDIIGHRYARNALEAMFAKGIMKNKDGNNFGVYDNISRGEFAQVLVKMLDIPLEYNEDNMTFDDVLAIDYTDALWNYRYIETAVKKGFIRGKSPRLFFPNDPLTRQEAAVMIARALNLVKSNANADKDLASLQKTFTDGGTVDIYAASSILAVTKAKFISGIPNTTPANTFRFEPNSYLSRADTAVIVEKVMKSLKKL